MKRRCYNKNDKDYKNYGARGITIHQEWLNSSISFYSWALNNGYLNNLTIDRINNNGNYSPNNCRWVTTKEQANNTRFNKLITIDGVTKTASQWADENGLDYHTIHERIKMGWDNNELIEPLRKEWQLVEINGEKKRLSEWAEISGIGYRTLLRRYRAGWDSKDLLLPISKKKYKDRGDRIDGVS